MAKKTKLSMQVMQARCTPQLFGLSALMCLVRCTRAFRRKSGQLPPASRLRSESAWPDYGERWPEGPQYTPGSKTREEQDKNQLFGTQAFEEGDGGSVEGRAPRDLAL